MQQAKQGSKFCVYRNAGEHDCSDTGTHVQYAVDADASLSVDPCERTRARPCVCVCVCVACSVCRKTSCKWSLLLTSR